MSKFSKHLGKEHKVMIDGEEFNLKPLTVAYLPQFFKVMGAFSGSGSGKSTEEILANITDEQANALGELIDKTLELSYPEEPIEERKQFGLKWMSVLIGEIIQLNSADMNELSKRDVRVKDKIEALKAKNAK